MKSFEATVRAVRSLVQGALAAGAVAAWQAVQAASEGSAFQPRILAVAVATAFVIAAVSYVYNIVAPRLGLADSVSTIALVRAGRTLLAGAVSTGLMAAWEAGYSAVQAGTFSPWIFLTAAASAAVTTVVAYVYNLVAPREPAAPPEIRP